MKKFLKVFCIIFLCLLVVFGIAIGVCYLVIPEETKQVLDIVVEYANTPLGIIGGSSITVGAVAFVIFKVVANYIIQKNKFNLESHKKEIEELKSKAKEYEEQANALNSNTKAILSGFSSEVDKLIGFVVKVCETSPNAKIKKIGEEIKNNADEYKEEIVKKIEIIDGGILEFNENLGIKELEEKLNDLSSKFERLVEQYDEREEEING